MAQDLSYIQTKIEERIKDIASDEATAMRPFMRFVDPIVIPRGSDTLNTRHSYGSRAWEARSGSDATVTELKSVLAATAVSAYRKKVQFFQDDPVDVILDWVTESTMGFMDTVDGDFWTKLATANTIARSATPALTGLAATGGGTIYLADDFTVTPLSGGSSFTQANAFSDTLTTGYLAAGLNARANWRTLGGDRDSAPNKPHMWHVAGISDSVKTVLGNRMADGGGLVGGYADSVDQVVQLPPGITSSATLWGLFFPRMIAIQGQILRGGPVMPVVREDFSCKAVESSEEPGVINVLGFGSYGMYVHPLAYGDLQLHGIA